jgi:hypothetical protein
LKIRLKTRAQAIYQAYQAYQARGEYARVFMETRDGKETVTFPPLPVEWISHARKGSLHLVEQGAGDEKPG